MGQSRVQLAGWGKKTLENFTTQQYPSSNRILYGELGIMYTMNLVLLL